MLFIETNIFKSNLHTHAYENKEKTQTKPKIKQV
jgi:hypothetical protein